MLQNNIELDLKTKLIESGTTQTEVAEKVGVSLAYVNRITKGREQIVNKTFVKIMTKRRRRSANTSTATSRSIPNMSADCVPCRSRSSSSWRSSTAPVRIIFSE